MNEEDDVEQTANHHTNGNFLPTAHQEEDDFHPDWLAIGETTVVDPVSPFDTEILIVATIEEDREVGVVSLTLDPMGLRKMHAQLGEIIDNQNYLMTGSTSGVETQRNEETDADDIPKISKFELITDPMGVSRMVDRLSGESPVKGMSWKALLFVFFALLTLTLMAIRGVVG